MSGLLVSLLFSALLSTSPDGVGAESKVASVEFGASCTYPQRSRLGRLGIRNNRRNVTGKDSHSDLCLSIEAILTRSTRN